MQAVCCVGTAIPLAAATAVAHRSGTLPHGAVVAARHVLGASRLVLPASALPLRVRAVRHVRSKGSAAVRSSAATEDIPVELDADFVASINEVCNKVLRVILSEDIQLVSQYKQELDELGQFLVQEGEMDAALLMLVLQAMLDHRLIKEAKALKGIYRTAYEKIGALVEDCGWKLSDPEEEGQAMVDDELLPPVMGKY